MFILKRTKNRRQVRIFSKMKYFFLTVEKHHIKINCYSEFQEWGMEMSQKQLN